MNEECKIAPPGPLFANSSIHCLLKPYLHKVSHNIRSPTTLPLSYPTNCFVEKVKQKIGLLRGGETTRVGESISAVRVTLASETLARFHGVTCGMSSVTKSPNFRF